MPGRPRNSTTSYLARVAVDRELVKTLAPSVEFIPGMPVELPVVTERRTMLDSPSLAELPRDLTIHFIRAAQHPLRNREVPWHRALFCAQAVDISNF
jgi:hypothetical protein